METTTTNYHHPSTAGIEGMGVNPKHPEYSSSSFSRNNEEDHHPIHTVMEESKLVMEEWITTIVPKIMPRIQTLVQQVTDLKHTISHQNHKEHDEHPENNTTTDHPNNYTHMNTELGIRFDETIAMEQQIQTLFNHLKVCKGKIHDSLEGNNPLYTKYTSAISKLRIFGRVCQKTAHQMTLDQYYHHTFLPQYETATVEYQHVIDQCQHVLLLVSNTRTCMKSSS